MDFDFSIRGALLALLATGWLGTPLFAQTEKTIEGDTSVYSNNEFISLVSKVLEEHEQKKLAQKEMSPFEIAEAIRTSFQAGRDDYQRNLLEIADWCLKENNKNFRAFGAAALGRSEGKLTKAQLKVLQEMSVSDPDAAARLQAIEARLAKRDYAFAEQILPTLKSDFPESVKIPALKLLAASGYSDTPKVLTDIVLNDPLSVHGELPIKALWLLRNSKPLPRKEKFSEAQGACIEAILKKYKQEQEKNESMDLFKKFIHALLLAGPSEIEGPLRFLEDPAFSLRYKIRFIRTWRDIDGYSFAKVLPRLLETLLSQELREEVLGEALTTFNKGESRPDEVALANFLRPLVSEKSPSAEGKNSARLKKLNLKLMVKTAQPQDFPLLLELLETEEESLYVRESAARRLGEIFPRLPSEAVQQVVLDRLQELLRKAQEEILLDAFHWLASVPKPIAETLTAQLLEKTVSPDWISSLASRPSSEMLSPEIWEALFKKLNRDHLPNPLDSEVLQHVQHLTEGDLGALFPETELKEVALRGLGGDPLYASVPTLLLKKLGAAENEISKAADAALTRLHPQSPYFYDAPVLLGTLAANGISTESLKDLSKKFLDKLFDEDVSPEKRILVYERLRSELPKLSAFLESTMASLIREQKGKTREGVVNACSLLCKIIDQHEIWFDPDSIANPDHGNSRASWATAMRSVGAAAIVKAAPFCPVAKVQIDGLSQKWLGKYVRPGQINGLLNLHDMEKKDQQMHAQNSPGSPVDAATVYAKAFASLLYDGLEKNPETAPKIAQFSAEIKLRNQDSLREDLRSFKTKTSYSGGSLLNNYAIGATSLLNAKIPSEVREWLLKIQKATEVQPGEAGGHLACRISYSSDHSSIDEAEDAAGRSILVYLALARTEKQPKVRQKWLKHLAECTAYFAEIAPILGAHLPRNGTHANSQDKQIRSNRAPYYFLPVLPFALDALRELEASELAKDFPDTQSTRNKLMQSLELVLRKEGLVKPSGNTTYSSSFAYNNALGALAAASACAAEKGDRAFSLSLLTDIEKDSTPTTVTVRKTH